jgi:hypothetical protein
MNERLIGTVAILAAALGVWSDGRGVAAQADREKARAVLARVRTSLGVSRVEAVRALSMSGTFQRVFVGGSLAGTFQRFSLDVSVVLPDFYERRETATMGSGSVTYVSGFRGSVLLNDVQTAGADMKFGSSWGPEQIEVERTEFARLVLGCLTLETASLPLAFADAGTAAGPGGDATVLEVTAPRGFAARLFIDQRTNRPVMLTYKSTVHLPPAAGSAAGSASAPPPAEMREVELRFSDHRAVNGIYVPHRVVKRSAGVTLEETVLRSVVVNPPGGPKTPKEPRRDDPSGPVSHHKPPEM